MSSSWVVGFIILSLILALIGMILNGYAVTQLPAAPATAKNYAIGSLVFYIFAFIFLIAALIAYFYGASEDIQLYVSEKTTDLSKSAADKTAAIARKNAAALEVQRQAKIDKLQAQLAALGVTELK